MTANHKDDLATLDPSRPGTFADGSWREHEINAVIMVRTLASRTRSMSSFGWSSHVFTLSA